MASATVSYLPSRATLWRRVLVRAFWIPRRRWTRLLLGPVLLATGVALVWGATPTRLSPLGLFGGMLGGIGLGWTLWPLFGAGLAVALSSRVRRHRAPVRLTVEAGVLELARGEDRTLYALADLERIERLAGEHWVAFRGGRWVVIPAVAAEGEPRALLRALMQRRSGSRVDR